MDRFVTASNTTVADRQRARDDRDVELYEALYFLWDNAQFRLDDAGEVEKELIGDKEYLRRVTKVGLCKRFSILPNGEVHGIATPMPDGDVQIGFKGLLSCGSVWVCPVCSNRIAQVRAEQIGTAIERWEGMGGKVAMLTLTMRHDRGQSLDELWSALSYAWSKVTSGRAWVRAQGEHGSRVNGKVRIPWLRSVEVTHGVNGWHVHVHAMLFLRGDADLDGLAASVFARWESALVRRGLAAPVARQGGLHAKWFDNAAEAVADYLTKSVYSGTPVQAGMELTRGGHKKGRKGGRTPFQILADCVIGQNDPESSPAKFARDMAIWYEWERASKGRRQLTWSRGLKEFLGIDDDLTDEEIAAEDRTTDSSVAVCSIGQLGNDPHTGDIGPGSTR